MTPGNLCAPPIHVRHSELKRYDPLTTYKSVCPVCKEGVLLVRRDDKTMELLKDDRCVFCGQRFIYDDIHGLNFKEQPTLN